MLEELLAPGHSGAEYDAWLINIGDGDQFGSGFVAINPNSKIPALLDRSTASADPGLRVRRDPALSGREIRRVPAERSADARRMPFLVVLADGQRALSRRRLRTLLCLCAGEDRICDRPLRDGGRSASSMCSTADWPKCLSGGRRLHHRRHGDPGPGMAAWRKAGSTAPASSCSVQDYKHVQRWADEIARAPGGAARAHGQPRLRRAVEQLHERHDASDFETKTQDKLTG